MVTTGIVWVMGPSESGSWFPLGKHTSLGGGNHRAAKEGAGNGVTPIPHGTVSQNYIFMLATTDSSLRGDLLSQNMTICSHV